MDLKIKIEQANKAYRSGNAIISDAEYDALLEQYKNSVSSIEFENFIETLNEGVIEYGKKEKHPWIMGSLSKIKAEEPENVLKFINKHIKNSLNISAKIDGISCRLHFKNGKLISATTRGDGYEGTIIDDKIFYIKNIPHQISIYDELDIRGELVILKSDFSTFTEFANPRNATAGIINRKEWNKNDINKISFIAYTILGTQYTKHEQFKILNDNKFLTAYNIELQLTECQQNNIVEKLCNCIENIESINLYDIDGLVLSDSTYINENKYRPESQIAFKINQQLAETRIIDIEFEGPTKNGSFCPVAILEPVELGGVSISRVTLHNLDFIAEKGIKYGSKIKIMRSGDVIPKVISVIDNTDTTDIEFPEICPSCGTKLQRDGVNLRCINKWCETQIIYQIMHFIKKLGVKHCSFATLKNFDITSFDKLINFIPNKKYKMQTNLYSELLEHVFTKSKQELLAALNFNGVGEILINKIVDFYGYDNIVAGNYNGLPHGIGETILQKFKDDIVDNLEIVNKFINDVRYNNLGLTGDNNKHKSTRLNGKSVCFTGKLFTMSRTEASKKAELAGFEVKNGVTKGLTYLVTNDTNSGSTKNKKAKEFGTIVINEREFVKLCDRSSIDLSEI